MFSSVRSDNRREVVPLPDIQCSNQGRQMGVAAHCPEELPEHYERLSRAITGPIRTYSAHKAVYHPG